jgi:serine/threonine protein kinase
MTLVLGSPMYMAPELINKTPYDERVDIWALGVLTYLLLSGKHPFGSLNLREMQQRILIHEP